MFKRTQQPQPKASAHEGPLTEADDPPAGREQDDSSVLADPEAAARVHALREHGQTAKYVHAHEGWTARLDTIQALVLSHKLPLLDGWNRQRRAVA